MKVAKKIVKFLVLGTLFIGIVGFAVMQLWNWLMPMLFQLPLITFWQALGLFALAKIFFGFNKGGGGWKKHKESWRPYWKERMAGMTPEERETFKQKMKEKWCAPRS